MFRDLIEISLMFQVRGQGQCHRRLVTENQIWEMIKTLKKQKAS